MVGRQNAHIARCPAPIGRCHDNHFWVLGRHFVKRFALCYHTVVCLSCLTCRSVCPVLSVTLVYCGQTIGWIKMKVKLGMSVGLGTVHLVLDGDPAYPSRKGQSP